MLSKSFQIIFVMAVSLVSLGLLSGCDRNLMKDKDGSGTTSSSISPDTKLIDHQISDVIYGEDDRKEIYEAPSAAHKEVAQSTVVLVDSSDLEYDSESLVYSHDSRTFGESQLLCSDEPYYSQYALGFCSGFLIAPNLVVTAGHCFNSAKECRSTKFVFDFALLESESDLQGPKNFPESDVYGCKEIIYDKDSWSASGSGVNTSSESDFAIVQLDRVVTGRSPLKINRSHEAEVGDEMFVVGHPSGIPSKITDHALVRTVKSETIVLNSDTYGGNSGSAVFSEETFRIEGILVTGETDFRFASKKWCYTSNVCPENGCQGEGVTKIQQILSHISDEFELTEPDFDETEGNIYYEFEEGYQCEKSNGRKVKSYKSKIKFVTKKGDSKVIFYGDKCQSSKNKQIEAFNTEDFDFSNDLGSVIYSDGRVFEQK